MFQFPKLQSVEIPKDIDGGIILIFFDIWKFLLCLIDIRSMSKSFQLIEIVYYLCHFSCSFSLDGSSLLVYNGEFRFFGGNSEKYPDDIIR